MQRTTWPSDPIYFEWAPKLEARKGLMLHNAALETLLQERDPGYSSVYLFDAPDALEIKASKSSKGFRKYEVWANQLVVDLDGGDAHLARAEAALKGLRYEVYSSGGKGYHMVFPHEWLHGKDVPEAHRQLVESWGIDADLSLYRHSSIVSLPGRIHPKTKNRKTLVRMVEGEMLVVPEPKAVNTPEFNIQTDVPDLAGAFLRLASLATTEPKMGGRHTALWSCSETLASLGIEYDTALDILRRVNECWTQPKPDDELLKAVQQGYGARSPASRGTK